MRTLRGVQTIPPTQRLDKWFEMGRVATKALLVMGMVPGAAGIGHLEYFGGGSSDCTTQTRNGNACVNLDLIE